MTFRFPAAVLAAVSAAAALVAAPAAQAQVLSLVPGSCGVQAESRPFTPWTDFSQYTPVAGGDFESGAYGWQLAGGASLSAGNESYNVSGQGQRSLALPGGSSALSPISCTDIYHPTLRLFVQNNGSPSSRLRVEAVYPTLLGVQTSTIGELNGSAHWAPSPVMSLLTDNLMATLSLQSTAIAFRFVPEDRTGDWHIDDVYLDPYARG
jgi:hypothetical protein